MTGKSIESLSDPNGLGEDLIVGIPEIDEEHRKFLSDVYRLDQSLNITRNMPEIRELMNQIIQNTGRHFVEEEEIFEQMRLPNIEQHSRAHEALLKELRNLRKKAEQDSVSEELIQDWTTLAELLLHHIKIHDMKCRHFLRERQPAPSRG